MNRLLILLFVSLASVLPAEMSKKTLKAWGELPVLHEGRVMPLDSKARLTLLQFSGRGKLGKEPAISWYSRLLFDAETTFDDLIFMINHPGVLEGMGVETEQFVEGERKPSTRRFSFNHLQPGLPKLEELARQAFEKEEDKRDLVDKESLRVFNNIDLYLRTGSVFAHTRPLPMVELSDAELLAMLELQPSERGYSYQTLQPRIVRLTPVLKEIPTQENPNTWTELQRQSFSLAAAMFDFRRRMTDQPLPILAGPPHGEQTWLAPLDALHDPDGDTELIAAAEAISKMQLGWNAQDDEAMMEHIEAVSGFTERRLPELHAVQMADKEARFNRADYFNKAKVYYLLGFFLATAVLFGARSKAIYYTAWALSSWALLLHLTGLGWRIAITARPPVTNLYGTFLFVGLVCLVLAMLVEAFQKDGLGLFAGSFVAMSFLFVAERFAVEGDTMHKLQAVLATNFWLSTHVIAVTMGYAGVWIAGVFGHIWLVQYLLGKDSKQLKKVQMPMDGVLGFGLTFAFLGTMLGGVWADQSWGRFWGWDPKENGALLIVLWTAALYHARIAGMIKERGMAIGNVIGCIVVLVAWLGVNLLGVGLHSYGFTKTMYTGFFGYIFIESVFLIAVVVLDILRKRDGEAPSAPSEPEQTPKEPLETPPLHEPTGNLL